MTNPIIEDPIHEWFNLTYAAYFVMPRSVLQSMPQEWQQRFLDVIREIDNVIDFDFEEHGLSYHVDRVDSNGKYIADPLRDYDRGRRQLPLRVEHDVYHRDDPYHLGAAATIDPNGHGQRSR